MHLYMHAHACQAHCHSGVPLHGLATCSYMKETSTIERRGNLNPGCEAHFPASPAQQTTGCRLSGLRHPPPSLPSGTLCARCCMSQEQETLLDEAQPSVLPIVTAAKLRPRVSNSAALQPRTGFISGAALGSEFGCGCSL